MFKNPSRKNSYLSFFRLYFLEMLIFLGFCLVSMVGIFYYFKHHPLDFSGCGNKLTTLGKLRESSESEQNEPEFEFYALLAEGNASLPATLKSDSDFS